MSKNRIYAGLPTPKGILLDMEDLPIAGFAHFKTDFKAIALNQSAKLSSVIFKCPLCSGPLAHTQGDVLIIFTETAPVLLYEFICGYCGSTHYIAPIGRRNRKKPVKPK